MNAPKSIISVLPLATLLSVVQFGDAILSCAVLPSPCLHDPFSPETMLCNPESMWYKILPTPRRLSLASGTRPCWVDFKRQMPNSMQGQTTSGEKHGSDGGFATTHWSVVLRAGQAGPEVTTALEHLFNTYWYPLYAFARRRGYTEHDSQDLTQGFCTHLIEHSSFKNVSREKGKFRSYLLSAFKNFMVDDHARRTAQKRGGKHVTISIDAVEAEERYRFEPRDVRTPELLYDRRWAMTILDLSLKELESEVRAEKKLQLFEAAKNLFLRTKTEETYASVSADLGITEEALKKTVQRLRKRYQVIIRHQIQRTLDQGEDIEEELRYLRQVLRD